MQTHPKEHQSSGWKKTFALVYSVLLSLYPKRFRNRFGSEMKTIFSEALWENRQEGFFQTLRFLGRELIEAPGSILDQHLTERTIWLRPYPMSLFIFSIGFLVLGVLETGEIFSFYYGDLISVIVFLLVGGLGGLIIGINYDSSKKMVFALCGAIGFLCAKTLIPYIFFLAFPNAFVTPEKGLDFWIPFLYPTLVGGGYGLFLGIASARWRNLLKFTILTSGAFTAGFLLNRLFAALMQSYILRSPTQIISQTGVAGLLLFILIPYFLQGILLGLAFGRISQRRAPTNAT